jgi:tRNA(Arg) A34 adenosine deaminase TadA
MCLGAVYWAQIRTVYFANTRLDAAAIGFNDSFIYDELGAALESRTIKMVPCGRDEALKVFNRWQLKGNRGLY